MSNKTEQKEETTATSEQEESQAIEAKAEAKQEQAPVKEAEQAEDFRAKYDDMTARFEELSAKHAIKLEETGDQKGAGDLIKQTLTATKTKLTKAEKAAKEWKTKYESLQSDITKQAQASYEKDLIGSVLDNVPKQHRKLARLALKGLKDAVSFSKGDYELADHAEVLLERLKNETPSIFNRSAPIKYGPSGHEAQQNVDDSWRQYLPGAR